MPRRVGQERPARRARRATRRSRGPLMGQPTGKESQRLDRARRIALGPRLHVSSAFTSRCCRPVAEPRCPPKV